MFCRRAIAVCFASCARGRRCRLHRVRRGRALVRRPAGSWLTVGGSRGRCRAERGQHEPPLALVLGLLLRPQQRGVARARGLRLLLDLRELEAPLHRAFCCEPPSRARPAARVRPLRLSPQRLAHAHEADQLLHHHLAVPDAVGGERVLPTVPPTDAPDRTTPGSTTWCGSRARRRSPCPSRRPSSSCA